MQQQGKPTEIILPGAIEADALFLGFEIQLAKGAQDFKIANFLEAILFY